MLIDVWRAVGLEGIAQVDLDVHRNSHQPLSALDADGADGAGDDRAVRWSAKGASAGRGWRLSRCLSARRLRASRDEDI